MWKKISVAAAALVLSMATTQAIIDDAAKDVTIYVVVPQEIPLTVPAGQSFKTAAMEFCNKNGLEPAAAANLTKALELKVEEMKIVEEPLFTMQVSLTNTIGTGDDQKSEEFSEKLEVFQGDTVFDAVYRFCVKQKMDIYTNGKALETMVIDAINNITAQAQLQEGAAVTTVTDQESGAETSESNPATVLPPVDLRTTPQENTDMTSEAAPSVNNTRFKLFSLPVKVDEKDVELDFYNGDHLNGKISEFCQEHGLNETVARQPLLDAVMNYTQAIQNKFPNSVWFESI